MKSVATLAFIFPGQGSQSLGMIEDLLEDAVAQEYLKRADEALGYELSTIIKEGPIEKLNDTAITQPALLTVSTILWQTFITQSDQRPAFVAGHSLGEYSALVAAEVLSFEDAVKLVALRGTYMQEAVPEGSGAMAAILGLDDEDVIALAAESEQEVGEVVAAVNFNSPGQVVIAGSRAGIDHACALAKERGARRALPLAVSVPSHCALMKPAAERLAEALATLTLNKPKIALLHNVDVAEHQSSEAIKEALVAQLYQPVRWTETIETLAKAGVTTLVECGPGRVLSGLNRRINRDLVSHNLSDGASLATLLETLG